MQVPPLSALLLFANFPGDLISSTTTTSLFIIVILIISLSLPLLLLLLLPLITASSFVKYRHFAHTVLALFGATLTSAAASLRRFSRFLKTLPVTQASSTAWSLLTAPPPSFLPFCFMPSASSSTLPTASNQQSSPTTQPTSNQHGIHPSVRQPRHPCDGDSPVLSPETNGSLPPEQSPVEEYRYLGQETHESETDYLLNSPPASPDTKGKSVVNKKFKHPNVKGKTYITKLPNEVLTHTLSFLDPVSLTSVSFVSRRFHALVTSPHAWKDAFSRYFPQHNTHSGSDAYPTAARYFTRLSNMGTHRSEYILRTQLLRSLKRGRPYINPGIKPSPSHNSSNFSMITYNPKLHESTVTHLHADFNRNRVIAASQYTGLYSYSDPRTGYVEVEQRGHPGYSSFGLQYISAEGIGALDISESRGQIIGDGRDTFPSFFVERANSTFAPVRFINEHGPDASITCIWLAKKDTIVNTSAHVIVSASGSSKGVVQFQDNSNRWMSFIVCPGIPILEIRIDDGYTKARERRNRVWCVIVNAIGEVWYMKGKLPKKPAAPSRNMGEQVEREFTPWFNIPVTRKTNTPVGIGILIPEDPNASSEALQQQQALMHTEPEVMALMYSDHWREDYFIEADFGGQNFILGCKGEDEGPNTDKRRATMKRYSRILDNVREEAISEVFIKNVYGRGYHKEVEELVPRAPDEVDPPDEWQSVELTIPQNKVIDYVLITSTAIDMSNIALLSPNEDPLLTRSSSHPLTPQQIVGQLSRLFAIGTNTGAIHIYNARHPIPSSSDTSLPPLHTISTASPSISSLALSSLYLVHGGTDGLVQAWDPLVSLTEPIRAIHSRFSTRARRRLAQAANSIHGIGENQFAARAIFLDPDPTQLRGIVALGTHIRSWSFSSSIEKVQENSNSRRRRKNARRGSNNGPYLGTSGISGKGRAGNSSKAPLPRDIIDETEIIAHTRYQDEVKKARMAERFGVGHEAMQGMTEEEMIMYAMMISEESFERERGLSEESGGNESSAGFQSAFGEGEEVWIYSESNGGSASAGFSESPGSPHGWTEPTQFEAGPSTFAGVTSASATNDDEVLAKALQESFDLEDIQPPNGDVGIPIKFAKNKNKKGKGKGVSVGLSDSGPSNVSNRRGSDGQFDRDLELAIQLSMQKH
ncbi:hypothetical protein TWF694_001461 [Orbilia ellipsospora]|uniref:F-box domain-containing protein n=1 Tax=Orbilia ellipsospora TaxID=2528407 RepID=A0AAV9XRV1_9PEZI